MFRCFNAATILILPCILGLSWWILSPNPGINLRFPFLQGVLPFSRHFPSEHYPFSRPYMVMLILVVAPVSRLLFRFALVGCLAIGVWLNYLQFQTQSGFTARHSLKAPRAYNLADLIINETDGDLSSYAWSFMALRPFLYQSTVYLPTNQKGRPDSFQLHNVARVASISYEDYDSSLTEARFKEISALATSPAGSISLIGSKQISIFLVPNSERKYRLFHYADSIVFYGADHVS
jgi:hypothetical protein